MSDSFEERLDRKLETLRSLELYRECTPTEGGMGRRVRVAGRSLINFASNDYLGLANDPRVVRAQVDAAETHGAGSGGSRLICGEHPLYRRLEDALARWKSCEACVVFGSGFLANVGTVPALTTGRDAILYDELSHRCLREGVALSRAEGIEFAHNDLGDLEARLDDVRADHDAVLVVTEGVFSMDGDRVDLSRLRGITGRYDAWTLLDEAHSTGVWGPAGAGLSSAESGGVEVAMGTLSKALGGYGGYVAGSRSLREFLINHAGSLIYSTGLPPAVVGGNLRALELLRDEPERRRRLRRHVRQLAGAFDEREIPRPDPPSQVVPIVTGGTERTLEAGGRMREAGIFAVPIRYPTVPRNTGRIRVSLRSDHTAEDRRQLLDAVDRLDADGLLERTAPWAG